MFLTKEMRRVLMENLRVRSYSLMMFSYSTLLYLSPPEQANPNCFVTTELVGFVFILTIVFYNQEVGLVSILFETYLKFPIPNICKILLQ